MAEYDFNQIEAKWQKNWKDTGIFSVDIDPEKPKYYVLDMFPYPSGAGLHVGHPLGYIASDIYSRYKKLCGYNVLHPMGFDAFGLPAEQYAIQTGQHPALTSENNIKRYKEQLQLIGFAYDWNREVRTCDPSYYKWTQWIFIRLFHSYYDLKTNKGEKIEKLIHSFEENGSGNTKAFCSKALEFSAEDWRAFGEKKQQEILMNYRLAYQAETTVNWCPALGTVLANDEVKDGYSVRGGHPVEQKLMKQWLLRVTAYAERLLEALQQIHWSDSLKEMQRNWIGKSQGASIFFQVWDQNKEIEIEVFTTRPDTLFGCTFLVLAPEHPLLMELCTEANKADVLEYVDETKKRTERDRLSDVKRVSGCFSGAYVKHPFSKEKLPVWVADYVLMQYGTGAVMCVPAHDSRDHAFARHFDIPLKEVVAGGDILKEAYEAKEGVMINSSFLNGMQVHEAIEFMNKKLEENGFGIPKTYYKLRDAIFSRQRYWGEPFPVFYKNNIPYTLDEKELPLELPELDTFLPTEKGEAPLARAKNWKTSQGYPLETDTMPGFAGSSAYYLRYMDPHNDEEFFSKESNAYWQDVDLYIGGTEHATGHLIYARFWNKFLYDMGLCVSDEPFQKLVNQGMIQGRSSLVYRVNSEKLAEHLLWQKLKKEALGVTFERNYKETTRRFDFFSKEARLIIEIKSRQNLEKLSDAYKKYCESKSYKLVLLTIREILSDINPVIDKIKKAVLSDAGNISIDFSYPPLNPLFISADHPWREAFSTPLHVDLKLVKDDVLDTEAFKKWRDDFKDAEFIFGDHGKYICGSQIEKMSKSLHNVVNPDDIIQKYGADTFRMYEMFLGPIEQHKPWNTDGIEGVFKFIRKFFNLFHDDSGNFTLNSLPPDEKELKILHKCISRITDDIEKLSFNTCISRFMITSNELSALNCNKRDILEKMLLLLAPFAPHICEELWGKAGHTTSIFNNSFPVHDPAYLIENSIEYPISVNGKLRMKHTMPADMDKESVEQEVLKLDGIQKWIENKQIRKIVFIPGRIINIVVS
jgi:leucyl-tRNA synthetase